MVNAQFLETCIKFALIYTEDDISRVLTIKDLINKGDEHTMPFKLVTGMKISKSYLHDLIVPCVVRKSTTYVGTKALNMHHQVQKVFAVSLL